MDKARFDYLFVSDLHISQGYDAERRAYHPREDFVFDEPFFRWLCWMDENCAPGKRWELVFVGDAFDFLPFDEELARRYLREKESRSGPLPTYWQQQFSAPPADPDAERLQRLLFEDDLLAGRLCLKPAEAAPAFAPLPNLPPWAVELHDRYQPPGKKSPALGLSALTLAEGEARPVEHNEAFERRYGFLPTPEKSADKVDVIYQGHPLFFRALARFVSRGHRVVFVRGNHDLELYWPAVQQRIRDCIEREVRAGLGIPAGQPLPCDLDQQVDFSPGWFYYRKGLFYAEHGKQYEPLDAVPNPIRPVMADDEWMLNPPVGSLAVTCIHTRLEDEYPEWENRGQAASAMLELIRRYPWQALSIILRHGIDFMWMARRLWRAGQGKEQGPGEEDLKHQAKVSGLDPQLIRNIYEAMARPLLLNRPLAWFLFSPLGHALKAVLIVAAVALVVFWYVAAVPWLATLIPAGFPSAALGPALRRLAEIVLWFGPFLLLSRALQQRAVRMGHDPYLSRAVRRIHAHLATHDPALRFYIMGHTHYTEADLVERRADGNHVYYLNTGCWFVEFAEDARRLQTVGQEVQFTFVRLLSGDGGVQADLLRWNDEAGRVERQMLPPARRTRALQQWSRLR